MNNKEILNKAKVIYDYLNVNTQISKADIIIGLGCMDKSIPKECANLFKKEYGKIIVFSGNVGKGTDGVLKQTEAERFKKIAIQEGVPVDKIILEEKATNTYENYKYTKKILIENNIKYNSAIVVHKPYVKRRCMAIADKEMSNKKTYITSEDISLEAFIKQQEENKTMSFNDIINEIVGEISIILTTPKYGMQSEQIVDESVLKAYEFLVEKGYVKYVIKENDIISVLNKWKNNSEF